MAEVTSDPAEIDISNDSHLWRCTPKNDLTVPVSSLSVGDTFRTVSGGNQYVVAENNMHLQPPSMRIEKLNKEGDYILKEENDESIKSDYHFPVVVINTLSGNPVPGADKPILRVGIRITHDLTARPILASTIKDVPALQKLKVGYSGTNFSATEEEYKALLKLIQANSAKMIDLPLNTILYGPPGTGKTFATLIEAVRRAEPSFVATGSSDAEKRVSYRERYHALKAEGRIQFITFHQSLSYEDFIEGIKPVEPSENDQFLQYAIQDGIFKKMCLSAKTPNQVGFEEAYQKLTNLLEDSENKPFKLNTPKGAEFAVSLNTKGNLRLHTGPTLNGQGVLTRENFQKQINGEEHFKVWQGYYLGVLKYFKESYGFDYTSNKQTAPKNYVLIIDEINRGNVSQIFGELITLIEEDKRAGKAEALEVVLPYSRDKFGVPSNLYIIGTMNTADRSVEALDTALRRRFSFKEMPPQEKLLSDAKLPIGVKVYYFKEILETINSRMEVLAGRDHRIGHSYFMGISDWKKYLHVFTDKIIPLLQEYFYGDYSRICMVLGEGFVGIKENPKSGGLFANLPKGSDSLDTVSAFEDKKIWEFKPIDTEESFAKALDSLLNIKNNGQ